MLAPQHRRLGTPAQIAALAGYVIRYSTSVSAVVKRELERWEERAQRIPDPVRRDQALEKLRDTAAHAWLNASFATLVPRPRRVDAVVASVALEVMYDYLDAITEIEEDVEHAVELFEAIRIPFLAEVTPIDMTDGGYLRELALASRAAFRSLPSSETAARLATDVATRCAATQARCHVLHTEAFEAWARRQPTPPGLEWSEAAAGNSAGVITLHALIALAADNLSHDAAAALVAAYDHVCSVATLLDSLIDRAEDDLTAAHSYVGHYDSIVRAKVRIPAVTRGALEAVASLPRAAHHTLTVAGIAAYYLSAPEAAEARALVAPAIREACSLVTPLLLMFRLLRRSRKSRFPSPRRAALPSGAATS
jgi:tetraprenyl-beta-curcumene synthase